MSKTIKYKNLIDFLGRLGFVNESVKGSHRAFRHAGSGTIFLLSDSYSEDDPVGEEDLVSVRRHLVENGLVSYDDFAKVAGSAFDTDAAKTSWMASSEEP